MLWEVRREGKGDRFFILYCRSEIKIIIYHWYHWLNLSCTSKTVITCFIDAKFHCYNSDSLFSWCRYMFICVLIRLVQRLISLIRRLIRDLLFWVQIPEIISFQGFFLGGLDQFWLRNSTFLWSFTEKKTFFYHKKITKSGISQPKNGMIPKQNIPPESWWSQLTVPKRTGI